MILYSPHETIPCRCITLHKSLFNGYGKNRDFAHCIYLIQVQLNSLAWLDSWSTCTCSGHYPWYRTIAMRCWVSWTNTERYVLIVQTCYKWETCCWIHCIPLCRPAMFNKKYNIMAPQLSMISDVCAIPLADNAVQYLIGFIILKRLMDNNWIGTSIIQSVIMICSGPYRTLNQCWFYAGLPSATLAHNLASIGSVSDVCWDISPHKQCS